MSEQDEVKAEVKVASGNGHKKRRSLGKQEIFTWGRERQELVIPELSTPDEDAVVYFERLSAGAVLDYVTAPAGSGEQRDAMLKLVASSMCNEDGALLFDDEEDLINLRETKASIFNRMSEALLAGVKNAEEKAKNVPGEAATPSASPTN